MTFKDFVGHTGAATSQTSNTPGGPTHLDLLNLRAKLSKVYKDAKDDNNDVATLSNIYDQFSEVSSCRESQGDFVLYRNHVRSTEYIQSPWWTVALSSLYVIRWTNENEGSFEDRNAN